MIPAPLTGSGLEEIKTVPPKLDPEDKLRIPSPKKLAALTELMTEDEDFRFPRVKLNRDKPKYELPEPNAEDRDNIELKGTFKGIILVARKNFYLSDEDKAKGADAKEKRALYVLRLNKVTPELIYVNPTSMKAWQMFVKSVVQSGQKFYSVVCEFSAETVNSQKTGFKWNKMKFAVDRTLAEDELEHVLTIREVVDARVKTYEDDSDLARYEEEALGTKAADDDEEVEKHSKKSRQNLEDDDEDEPVAKKPGSKGKTADKAPAKKKAVVEDDDDEDEAPKKKKKPADDDEDEDEAPKKKKKPVADDDDDEDEAPAKKKKKPVDDDDEDEAPAKKKSSAKAGYSSLDDDDDLDQAPAKKKKKADDDDDDEDEAPKKKKKAASLDDDDDED